MIHVALHGIIYYGVCNEERVEDVFLRTTYDREVGQFIRNTNQVRRPNGSVSIPGRTKIFLSFSKRPDRIWCPHRLLCSRKCGESPSSAKQPGGETDHTSLSEV